MTDQIQIFDRERHIQYFVNHLRQLPTPYTKLDSNRLTLVHFAVHALDMLGIWDEDDTILQEKYKINRTAIIEWIYSLQTTTDDVNEIQKDGWKMVGFKGGSSLGIPPPEEYNYGHIAMTYTALATLHTLGDTTLRRVDKLGILRALQALQLSNDDDTNDISNTTNNNYSIGSYQCISGCCGSSEYDMRFLYCACCICYMFNDYSSINIANAIRYIKNCHSWDGAFALLPGQEGHGGSTFCAVASLVLLNQLDDVLDTPSSSSTTWRDDLIQWCTVRQVGGMQGRPGKLEDTCYSYWIGGTLRLLDTDYLLDHTKLQSFVLQCQTMWGGFGKVITAFPDMLHSFYSMSYLNLSQHYTTTNNDNDDYTNTDPTSSNNDQQRNIVLKPFNCTLGICQERAELFAAYATRPIP